MMKRTSRTPASQRYALIVGPEHHGLRLDRFLAEELKDKGLSRERIQGLIRDSQVTLGGEPERSTKARVREGEEVVLTVALPPSSLQPEPGHLEILYRDAVLAAINKPAGLTTHPAAGLDSGTLAHRLLAHFPELAGQPGNRPGIVHRLDKDTSGLMLVALSEECRLALSDMFARHEIHKEYLALVSGVPGELEGEIDAPLGRHPFYKTKMTVLHGGRKARTTWRVLYADPDGRFALLAVRIFSGRTHQVRVHLAHIGHPLLGDAVYGGEACLRPDMPDRQMLHAWKLGFTHPLPDKAGPPFADRLSANSPSQGNELRFCCPPPEDFLRGVRRQCQAALRVVITGPPGCGKSAVLSFIRERDHCTFSADHCVAELYEPGGDGHHLLAARYGERFVPDPKKPVDKAALGAAMRESDALRREVEAMLHPLVFAALEDFWQKNTHRNIAVAEIPLYLESGRDRQTPPHERPVLVGVSCPAAARRERLETVRGWSPETIARVESWQWPEDRKLAACDLIIENKSTLARLDRDTAHLLRRLFALRFERITKAAETIAAQWQCPDD